MLLTFEILVTYLYCLVDEAMKEIVHLVLSYLCIFIFDELISGRVKISKYLSFVNAYIKFLLVFLSSRLTFNLTEKFKYTSARTELNMLLWFELYSL